MGSIPDFAGLVIFLAAFAVFGVWKVIEMIIWLFNHVSIS